MGREYLYYFPKERLYPNQGKAMDKIYEALTKGQVFLFEGACGTGKTLSALAPALCVAQQENKIVVIATKVHQQMEQFIEEAKEIKKKTNIKVVVLKRKSLTCPKLIRDDQIKDDEDFKDNCAILRENASLFFKDPKKYSKLKVCEYYLNSLRADKNAFDRFEDWYYSDVRGPEEILNWGLEREVCGYEFLKLLVYEADLLICNYRHLLDVNIFNNVLKLLKKSPHDLIAIFDEAHNIESEARAIISDGLSEVTVEKALKEIDEVEVTINEAQNKEHTKFTIEDKQKIGKFLKISLNTMVEVYEKRLKLKHVEKVGSDWLDIRIVNPEELEKRVNQFWRPYLINLRKAGIQNLDEITELTVEFGKMVQNITRKPSMCITVAKFITAYMKLMKSPNYYPLMSVRGDMTGKGRLRGRLELYNIFPKIVTGPLLTSLYGAVLMSATLQPLDILKKILDIKKDTSCFLSCSNYPKNNRLTIAVPIKALFAKTRDSPDSTRIVTQVLDDIIEGSDGNVLVFFQNYQEVIRYKKRLKCDVPVFLNEKGKSAQKTKDDFFKIGESGGKAVLISYLWGPLAEGVDYKDARGRTVVIVG